MCATGCAMCHDSCHALQATRMLCTYVMLCSDLLCSALLCSAILCYAMLRYGMVYATLWTMDLWYAMVCYAMLCHAMLRGFVVVTVLVLAWCVHGCSLTTMERHNKWRYLLPRPRFVLEYGFGTVLAASWPILENPEGPSASTWRTNHVQAA